MNTAHHIDACFSIAVDKLEGFITRLTREDPRLTITLEHGAYVCEDIANGHVMIPPNKDPLAVVKWARCYVLMTDGAWLDERSVSAALGSGEVPTSVEVVTAPPDPQAAEAAAGEPATSLDHPSRHLRVVV